jgi:hypothetical protein
MAIGGGRFRPAARASPLSKKLTKQQRLGSFGTDAVEPASYSSDGPAIVALRGNL